MKPSPFLIVTFMFWSIGFVKDTPKSYLIYVSLNTNVG